MQSGTEGYSMLWLWEEQAQGRVAYQGNSLSLSANYLMGPIFLQGCRDCDMVVVEGVTAVRGEPIYDSV